MTLVTATDARKRLDELVNDVTETHVPVQISGKRGNAVLISEADWRAIQETLHLAAVPGMTESIVKGMKTPPAKCSEDPGW